MIWRGVPSDPNDWRLLATRQAERLIQKHATDALTLIGFYVCDMSQGRETRQEPGIPDLYMYSLRWGVVGWCEVKLPQLWEPSSGRYKDRPYRERQRQGKWSFEQHLWQLRHRSMGVHSYTIDAAEQAVAYWAWRGYPVPPDMFREPWDDEAQERFYDPNARPMREQARAYGRKTPKTYRPRRFR